MSTNIKVIFESIFLALIGAITISFIEAIYYEKTFYRPALSQLYWNTLNVSPNMAYAIYPLNWEARLYSRVEYRTFIETGQTDSTYDFRANIINSKYEPFINGFALTVNATEANNLKLWLDNTLKKSNAVWRLLSGTMAAAIQRLHLLFG